MFLEVEVATHRSWHVRGNVVINLLAEYLTFNEIRGRLNNSNWEATSTVRNWSARASGHPEVLALNLTVSIGSIQTTVQLPLVGVNNVPIADIGV
jgi:hypothetical protein